MTIRAALMQPSFKRLVALTAVYVLALQALFGAGAQLRVLLAETPGLCTILGFQEPGAPKHAADACVVHCAGLANQDSGRLAAVAALLLAVTGWVLAQGRSRPMTPSLARAFYGRGPPN